MVACGTDHSDKRHRRRKQSTKEEVSLGSQRLSLGLLQDIKQEMPRMQQNLPCTPCLSPGVLRLLLRRKLFFQAEKMDHEILKSPKSIQESGSS